MMARPKPIKACEECGTCWPTYIRFWRRPRKGDTGLVGASMATVGICSGGAKNALQALA